MYDVQLALLLFTPSDSENGLSCDVTGGTLKCKVGENQCFTVTGDS